MLPLPFSALLIIKSPTKRAVLFSAPGVWGRAWLWEKAWVLLGPRSAANSAPLASHATSERQSTKRKD